jgi:hypothetical protein
MCIPFTYSNFDQTQQVTTVHAKGGAMTKLDGTRLAGAATWPSASLIGRICAFRRVAQTKYT